MLMQMLEAAGLEIVADFERAADPDNPEGYYELERVKKIDRGEDTAWLHEVRGKAIKIVSHYVRFLPNRNNYRVIFLHRDLDEILRSQTKMLERRGEDAGPDDGHMRQLYAEHLAETARELADRSCFEVLDVRHRDTISDPETTARRIDRFLEGDHDVEAMAAVVNPDMYRNRHAT